MLFPFMGTPYQRPGLLGVPVKEKSNYEYPPLFGDGEDIFAFAVLANARDKPYLESADNSAR
jgi:hypothetical protein